MPKENDSSQECNESLFYYAPRNTGALPSATRPPRGRVTPTPHSSPLGVPGERGALRPSSASGGASKRGLPGTGCSVPGMWGGSSGWGIRAPTFIFQSRFSPVFFFLPALGFHLLHERRFLSWQARGGCELVDGCRYDVTIRACLNPPPKSTGTNRMEDRLPDELVLIGV